MIYFDNASTTKSFSLINKTIVDILDNMFFNPSSLHTPGFDVKQKLEKARSNILQLLNAFNFNLVFTGSATEANNLAFFQFKKGKCLIGMGEHPSILEVAKNLKNQGKDIEFVPLDKSGKVDIVKFKELLSDDISFVSVQMVSNETGAINDIKNLVKITKQYAPRAIFHSDLVQAVGKLEVNINNLGVDLATISAHKIHGPKGIGALLFNKKLSIIPQILGGGQEMGLRSGTENVAYAVAFAEALDYCIKNQNKAYENAVMYRKTITDAFDNSKLKYSINGCGSPFIMSVSFFNVRGETVMHALEQYDILVSTGSACSSKKTGNRTLEAMGLNKEYINGNIRISFGHEEFPLDVVKKAALDIIECVNTLQRI